MRKTTFLRTFSYCISLFSLVALGLFCLPTFASDVPSIQSAPSTQTKIINISSEEMQGNLIKKVLPNYPQIAKATRVQGIVMLEAIIGKDGHIKEIHVVSGPDLLREEALNAVKEWIYKPYILNGEAVEVKTTVNVIFSLGKSKHKKK